MSMPQETPGLNFDKAGTPEPVAGKLDHAFVFYSLTPGRCGYGPNLDELCGAMRYAHSPVFERRQMLSDYALSLALNPDPEGSTKLIERATRVRLTDEIIASAEDGVWGGGGRERARRVLEAAGFEVIE